VQQPQGDAELWDGLPDGVVIADGDGRVLVCNATARRMLGDWPAEDLATIPLQDHKGADWFSTTAPYDGLGSRVGIPEQSWLALDGTELLVNARLHRPSRSAPVDRVSLALRSGRGRAILDRERSDLVATVAHELRSPLTGVRGFVTTLLDRWDRLNDEQKRLMLTTVKADATRLSQLIVELLDVARIDTGRLPLYPRPVEVAVVVDRVVESIGQGTTRELRTDIPDREVTVHADPDKLTQVVTNLVENAVRHGEGTIEVSVRAAGDHALIAVSDEGEGIPDAIRARVFTKFWRHGASGGSGLGMYIVNGLTRVHGGTVTIGDAPGGGARIEVRWPLGDG